MSVEESSSGDDESLVEEVEEEDVNEDKSEVSSAVFL